MEMKKKNVNIADKLNKLRHLWSPFSGLSRVQVSLVLDLCFGLVSDSGAEPLAQSDVLSSLDEDFVKYIYIFSSALTSLPV